MNPNVLGVGMPGGTYTGKQRGSIIREAFFVNIANAWTVWQILMDPIKMKFHINEYTNVELHFQNKVLTTLDTEAKTK